MALARKEPSRLRCNHNPALPSCCATTAYRSTPKHPRSSSCPYWRFQQTVGGVQWRAFSAGSPGRRDGEVLCARPGAQEEFPAALAERIMKEAREQQEEIAAEGDPLRQADPDSVRRCHGGAASRNETSLSSGRSVSVVTDALWSPARSSASMKYIP